MQELKFVKIVNWPKIILKLKRLKTGKLSACRLDVQSKDCVERQIDMHYEVALFLLNIDKIADETISFSWF